MPRKNKAEEVVRLWAVTFPQTRAGVIPLANFYFNEIKLVRRRFWHTYRPIKLVVLIMVAIIIIIIRKPRDEKKKVSENQIVGVIGRVL